MSFFFRPAFYPERPIYPSSWPAVSDDETYYRRVAEEHQRRAQAAHALAQEEERRRRQVAAQRLHYEEPHLRPEHRPEYYLPNRSHYTHDFPFDTYDSQLPPRYEHHRPDVSQRSPSPVPRSPQQPIRDDHERRIEEWLQRRRQRELEEAEFKRLKELERRRDDKLMREMLAALGIDSLQRNRTAPAATSSPRLTRRTLEEELDPTSAAPRQAPTHSQTCACGRHIPSPQPVQAAEPASTPSTSPSPDFPSQLWNALSSGRSNEERASILRDLGLDVPFNVSLAPNTRHPAAEQRPTRIPAQRSTAAPRPTTPKLQTQPSRPAPIPIPVVVRSPAPATPHPKPSTSRNLSSASVKQSPFAHIESIQIKFDSLRASTPDLSDPQEKREYLAELNKLLTSLDTVESSGSESIRGARKALARAVEDELEKVEEDRDVRKHEAGEDQHAEEAKVEVKEAGKLSVAEAAPEPQASAQSVAKEVEIKSLSESEPTQLHSIETTIEEPADAAGQPLSTKLEPSSQPVSTEGENHPEAPATTPSITVSTSEDGAKPEVDAGDEKVHGASEDTERQPECGRQPTVTSQDSKSPRTRRPPSVEIEEVPDEESLSGSPQVDYKDLQGDSRPITGHYLT